MRLFNSRRPNRFSGVPVVRVNSLWSSWVLGCLTNVFFVFVILAFALGAWLWSYRGGVAASARSVATLPPLALATATLSIFPTATFIPTVAPSATSTPLPSATPLPTATPLPSATPLPTATPFTVTFVIPTVAPSPVPLYSFQELDSGSASVSVVSEFAYGLYRALCVGPDRPFIQPRVVGVPEKTGLVWKLWNDYGYEDILDHTKDVTFFLGDSPSLFHVALFWYDQQVSDDVLIDYPANCPSTQIIFVQARPPLADNVSVSPVVSVTVQ